eukprot:11020809-Heterocapsa_arctica.AAC.1
MAARIICSEFYVVEYDMQLNKVSYPVGRGDDIRRSATYKIRSTWTAATQEGCAAGCTTIQPINSIDLPERQPEARHCWMGSRGRTAMHVVAME